MKNSPLNILISSGGTNVPIDDVRHISNFSRGATGSVIAETALHSGHIVDFIHSKGSQKPFGKSLEVNRNCTDSQVEMQRLASNLEVFQTLKPQLTEIPIQEFYGYQQSLLENLENPEIDVAILAMAVSDYGPEKVDGKIRSGSDNMTLQLKKLPKIISQVKELRPDIFLVGFKFLTQEYSDDELIETAYSALQRDNQNLVVANKASPGMTGFRTYIITPDKQVMPIKNRKDLPSALLGIIEERTSKNFPFTQGY